MAIILIFSKTLGGSTPNDLLLGGGTGLNFGQVNASAYAPLDDKDLNTGHLDLYIRHNGVDPITDVKSYISFYTQAYGGLKSPSNDYTSTVARGLGDPQTTANNSDGLSKGLRVEHEGTSIGSLGLNAFLPSRPQVSIYGASNQGISYETGIPLHSSALIVDNSPSEGTPSAPETGKIGPSGDTTLGDTAHIGLRYYLEENATDQAIIQLDYVMSYYSTS